MGQVTLVMNEYCVLRCTCLQESVFVSFKLTSWLNSLSLQKFRVMDEEKESKYPQGMAGYQNT